MLRAAAVVALVLAAAGSATGFVGIQGSYTTTISGLEPAVLNGSWRVAFHGGIETITHLGKKAVSGHYTLAGNRITISRESGPYSCGSKPGVYRWSLSQRSKLLTLVAVTDTCTGRKLVLTSHPLRKVA